MLCWRKQQGGAFSQSSKNKRGGFFHMERLYVVPRGSESKTAALASEKVQRFVRLKFSNSTSVTRTGLFLKQR